MLNLLIGKIKTYDHSNYSIANQYANTKKLERTWFHFRFEHPIRATFEGIKL